MWENTTPSTELPRDFCAGIGPLQLGVVLVTIIFTCGNTFVLTAIDNPPEEEESQFDPLEKTCIWGKHSFGILRPSTYQIWMMPSANYSLLFKIQDGGGGHLENWGNRYFIVIATFVYTYRDYNYTYLQHLTSQIFSPSFSNDIRDKNRHFIIFWCQMWNIVIYFWKKYIMILLSPSLKSIKQNL